jgi:hypothetical protein
MNYHYCDYRYYVYYTEIEWHKCLLSGLRRRNPPASPLIVSLPLLLLSRGRPLPTQFARRTSANPPLLFPLLHPPTRVDLNVLPTPGTSAPPRPTSGDPDLPPLSSQPPDPEWHELLLRSRGSPAWELPCAATQRRGCGQWQVSYRTLPCS